MSTLRIERTIDSTTLTIPELAEFVGQSVEIVVQLHPKSPTAGNQDRWQALRDVARDPGDFDFEAVERQREYDLREAEARLK